MDDPASLPDGRATFLFTDLEDSTRLWELHRDAMREALAHHDAVMQAAIEAHAGILVKHTGDGVYAVFPDAAQAAAACITAQRALQARTFGRVTLRARMAIYSGVAEKRGRDYRGPVLNRAARLMAAAHGGQVLVSQSAKADLEGRLPAGTHLRDLGARRLRDVREAEQVFQLVAEDLPASFPPLRTVDVRPANLPASTTAFIGREDEVRHIADALRDGHARLHTITGVGGTGKTRLAIEVARCLVDDFVDGVVFVPLAAISNPALVAPAIAHALGVQEEAGERFVETLGKALRAKHLLLVLDNFEQVVDAAPLVSELLEAAPRLFVVVTSRELLRVAGERDHAAPPLPVPDLRAPIPLRMLETIDSVRLFMACARAVQPELRLTEGNADVVARLCCRLEGLPLAIELAAARVRVIPLERMLHELDDRLRFLAGGRRDQPERRRSLRATIDWSYDSLGESERALFRRLAVFVDGASLEAIEAVCRAEDGTDVVATLESLVAKSLVYRAGTPEAPRFAMLETIRDYARELAVGKADAARVAALHSQYFADLAQAAFTHLDSAAEREWHRRLESENENLRAALAREAAAGGAAGLRLCKSLRSYWAGRGRLSEGRDWCTRMLRATADRPDEEDRIATAHTLAVLAGQQNDYDVAKPMLEYCAGQFRARNDMLKTGRALINLAHVLYHLGDLAEARRIYEEGLSIKREIGDAPSKALGGLALVHLEEGDVAQARSLIDEAVARSREAGDRAGLAVALVNLASIAAAGQDLNLARSASEEGIALLRQLGGKDVLATALAQLGHIALDQQAGSEAGRCFGESLALAVEVGDRETVAVVLEGLGVLAADPMIAARHLGAAARIRERIRQPSSARDRATEAIFARARERAADVAAFDAAWAEGRSATLDEAVALALHDAVCVSPGPWLS